MHGPTLGDRVQGIAMMTGDFSRPHSVRYGAITQLGPARNGVPVHINIVEGGQLVLAPGRRWSRRNIYLFIYITVIIFLYYI